MTKLDKGGLNMGTPFLLGQEPQIQVKMSERVFRMWIGNVRI